MINKRYVLTAAHCVCKENVLDCDENKNPLYDISQWVKGKIIPKYLNQNILSSVYLGVNDKKVDYVNTNLKGLTQYEYGVEWGKAHPRYNGAFHDMGLYKLDRDAVFETDFLQPICLPLK